MGCCLVYRLLSGLSEKGLADGLRKRSIWLKMPDRHQELRAACATLKHKDDSSRGPDMKGVTNIFLIDFELESNN